MCLSSWWRGSSSCNVLFVFLVLVRGKPGFCFAALDGQRLQVQTWCPPLGAVDIRTCAYCLPSGPILMMIPA